MSINKKGWLIVEASDQQEVRQRTKKLQQPRAKCKGVQQGARCGWTARWSGDEWPTRSVDGCQARSEERDGRPTEGGARTSRASGNRAGLRTEGALADPPF